MYKVKNDLSGKDTYDIFEKYGVIEYLQDGYEMLHTQGDGWIINDIEDFLKIRGYNNW